MKRLARMQLATAVIIYGSMDIPISMAMDIATTSLLPMSLQTCRPIPLGTSQELQSRIWTL